MHSKMLHTSDQGIFNEIGIIGGAIREVETTSGEVRPMGATSSFLISTNYEDDVIVNE